MATEFQDENNVYYLEMPNEMPNTKVSDMLTRAGEMKLPFAILISETDSGLVFMSGCEQGSLSVAETIYLLESVKTAIMALNRRK